MGVCRLEPLSGKLLLPFTKDDFEFISQRLQLPEQFSQSMQARIPCAYKFTSPTNVVGKASEPVICQCSHIRVSTTYSYVAQAISSNSVSTDPPTTISSLATAPPPILLTLSYSPKHRTTHSSPSFAELSYLNST